MPNKKPGYQFSIFDEMNRDTKQEFAEAIKKIEDKYKKQLHYLDEEIASYIRDDPDDENSEIRRDRRAAEKERDELESERNKEMDALLKKYPDMQKPR